MHFPPSLHSRGFTLIELAVVLVVIGLIVGGILVGRDLIVASAIRAQLSQIDRIHTAANTFRTKYNALPGDMEVAEATKLGFVTAGCTGGTGRRDGNHQIEGASGTFVQDGGETALFWQDLAAERLTDIRLGSTRNCNSGVTNLPATGVHLILPQAKIATSHYLYLMYTGGMHWIGLSAVSGTSPASNLLIAASLPVAQAHSMDMKVDDGLPTTGTVRARYYLSNGLLQNAPNAGADSSSTCYNTAGTGAYSIAYNNGAEANCALSFRFH